MVRPMNSSEGRRNRNTPTGIRIRNSKVRENRFHLTRRQILVIAFMLFIFMGSGIGYVWCSFEGTQIGYDLSRLRQEELRLKGLNQKLRVELATLKSPQYLEEATRGSGLKAPIASQIVILP